VLAVLLYVLLACTRAGHPFELEWQEGGVLDHVRRVLDGRPIYVEPSIEFIPFPYPPLYYWAGAALARVAGAEFLALRALSFAASLVALGALFRIARREADSRLAGLLAAGLFAAAWRFAGAWFDLARVDSLALALTLVGVDLAHRRRGAASAIGAGLAFAAAGLAKQTTLGLAVGAALGLALGRRSRDAALVLATASAVLLGTALVLEAQSEGWFSFWVVRLLAGQPLHGPAVGGFWVRLGIGLGVAFALPVWARFRAGGGWPVRDPLLVGLVVAGVLTSWISASKIGAYDNALLPACAAAALLFGTSLAEPLRRGPARAASVALVAGLGQFALLAYSPSAQLPSAADARAGERLVRAIAAVPGEVWVPYHGYLASASGRPARAHAMGLIDLLASDRHEVAGGLVRQIERALDEKRFELLLLDDLAWEQSLPALPRSYRRAPEPWFEPGERTFVPVTGAPWRPLFGYSPR